MIIVTRALDLANAVAKAAAKAYIGDRAVPIGAGLCVAAGLLVSFGAASASPAYMAVGSLVAAITAAAAEGARRSLVRDITATRAVSAARAASLRHRKASRIVDHGDARTHYAGRRPYFDHHIACQCAACRGLDGLQEEQP